MMTKIFYVLPLACVYCIYFVIKILCISPGVMVVCPQSILSMAI